MSKTRNNLRAIFHAAIITFGLLALSGCGHKGPPVYTPSGATSSPDANQTVPGEKFTPPEQNTF